ncbi:MAG: TPM domain-containing protein [Cyclobacteriaceae bacterium]|nr:TPM domain-containing protein [Cyclobacteriaceae bacterium]
MKKWFWFFVLAATVAQAQTYTVQTVPDTKRVDNSYVSNPDNLITAETTSQLNQQLAALEQQTMAQVAVVLLTSIGTETDVDFAQSLFRLWGIGNSGNDNGLLILYVEDQRVIRFHTGYGLEGILPDVICKRIQTQLMVPRFREGNTDAGILAGVEEVIRIISNPEYAGEVAADKSSARSAMEWFVLIFMIGWAVILAIVFLANLSDGFSNSKHVSKRVPSASLSIGQWLLLVFLLPMALAYLLSTTGSWLLLAGGLYLYFDMLVLAKYNRIINRAHAWLSNGKLSVAQDFMKEHNVWDEWSLLFPLPFIFLGGRYRKLMAGLRTRPKQCKKCSRQMTLLRNAAEKDFLTEQQQLEKKIKSITYDVWQCTGCASTLIQKYPSEKKSYESCPKCGTVAYQSTSKILKPATFSETGKRRITSTCKYCAYTAEQESTIRKKEKRQPREPAISIKESIRLSSYDDRSDNSWYDNDNSSGGSWGGGDSGGGGASSRW